MSMTTGSPLNSKGTASENQENRPVDVENDFSHSHKEKPEEEFQYLTGISLVSILVSILLALFLVALDRTIIATAIPFITNEFHSVGDIGWYGSAYMLANSSVILLYGRIYKFYSTKWVYLVAIGLFEIGSLVCATAPNSVALIIGRAIAGLGSAGIFSGGMMVLLRTVPLHKRPLYSGLFGAVFGVASVVGPVLGGAFTDKLTWRWCFYINLPIGGVVMLIIAFILKIPGPKEAGSTSKAQIGQLDLLGTSFFIPSMVCLILALQWGGSAYSWSDGRVIALLVIFTVLFIVFVGIQIWKGDNGTIPPRIIQQRSIAFGFLYSFCASASMMVFVYYLPIWFQAIEGVNAFESGIRTLALIISLVISSIFGGIATTRIGYYVPAMIASPVLMSIGAGLLTTLTPDTGASKYIGYQVILGFGLGLGMQSAALAAQATLSHTDISIGIAIIMFGQQLGGSIFISVGQNVFASNLVSSLERIPGVRIDILSDTGATNIRNAVPAKLLDSVLLAYNESLMKCFDIGLAVSCILIVGALGMEWKNIKKNKGIPKSQETSRNRNEETEERIDSAG